jgi:serine/threonine-protein kinase
MSLSSGARVGGFEIVGHLGSGGMGDVYRARDLKLGREVAIKVLPEDVAGSEERLARFEREARILAALNHPGIATLHGLETSTGGPLLVMELVEGETLAARLSRGSLPIDEALTFFRQIAEALESAHGKGILHRDLKPSNVMITPEGRVKLLDFGLAKAFLDEVPESGSSQSPTLTKGTAHGVILGTASYMSPEQARGKSVDRRTDIWAFGAVLFEALSGRKAFAAETVTDTLAAVVRGEPDLAALPGATPARVRDLVSRCLRKDANGESSTSETCGSRSRKPARPNNQSPCDAGGSRRRWRSSRLRGLPGLSRDRASNRKR